MIGFDSAAAGLIDRWTADGRLPTLAALRRRGAFGRMESTAQLNASPWPSFLTGTNPGDHGYHSFLMWDPERMRHRRPDGRWPEVTPFWRELSTQGPRVITLDVPDTFPGPPFNGLEVGNWAGHYRMGPSYTIPADRMKAIKKRFGKDPMPLEKSGVMPVEGLLAIRDRLIDVTKVQTRLALELIRSEPWDLFLMVYGATHRAGHQFWNDTGVEGTVPARRRAEFDQALLSIYAECDAGLGQILAQIDETTPVIVFACHGMTDNRSMVDLLPEMLRRVVHGNDQSSGLSRGTSSGLSQRLRQLLPLSWRSAVKDRLPQSWQDSLTLAWRVERQDWATTPVFCTMPDLQGHIQVNLAGRERNGIVRPDEYEFWLRKVTDGLMTFVDEDTGEPIVKAIWRPREMYPDGRMAHFLPDLIVEWPPRMAARFTGMTSPRFGRITSPFNGKAPEGRPGHHDFDGWLITTGPGIAAGSSIGRIHELDIAPSLYQWFGLTIPSHFRGKPAEGLLPRPRAVRSG